MASGLLILGTQRNTNPEDDMSNQIANTLCEQIGNGTFAMLGTRQIVALEDGIQFDIRGCKAGNKLVIKLTAYDTYIVELWSIRGAKCAKAGELLGVYVDCLHSAIEELTGLRTRL